MENYSEKNGWKYGCINWIYNIEIKLVNNGTSD